MKGCLVCGGVSHAAARVGVDCFHHVNKLLYEADAEIARLRKALTKYGQHHLACRLKSVQELCVCGFDAALTAYAAQQMRKAEARV